MKNKRWIAHLSGVALMGTPLSLVAQPAGNHVPSVAGSLVSVVLALLFIILVIFLCAWFLRKIVGGNFVTNKAIEVKASQPVGAKERLVIVKVDGKHLLLGVTAGGIQHLAELSENCIAETPQSNGSFKEALTLQLKKSLGKHHE
jgi:flagellar protein FliO/FliZ